MMKFIQHTYLFRLYAEFKLLFVSVCIFILATSWFALHTSEEFPFLLYGMYSLKEEATETYTAYSILVDGKELKYADMHDTREELISSLIRELDSPATEVKEAWLCNKISSSAKQIQVFKLTCNYTADGLPHVLQKQLMYECH
ncbi:MAG: hypothetical protein NTY88_12080 [Bacteroidetes bacterium]|nr:hypothetical protein [Bacteroidota bacterium]